MGCRSEGLCYPDCQPGYHGQGPVCWADCHAGYRDLGVACARKPFHLYFKHFHWRGGGRAPHCAPGQQQDAALCYAPCRLDHRQFGPICLPVLSHVQCGGSFNASCGAFCSTSKEGCYETAAAVGHDITQISRAVRRAERDCVAAYVFQSAVDFGHCMADFLGAALGVEHVAAVFTHC